MPDLLTEKPAVQAPPTIIVQNDNSEILAVLKQILKVERRAHPYQRAIVKLANGKTTFGAGTSEPAALVEFFNEGMRVKVHQLIISNNTSALILVSLDAPTTINSTAYDGIRIPTSTVLQITAEVQRLYIASTSPGPWAINNSDNGSTNMIVHIDAWTNPEEALRGTSAF